MSLSPSASPSVSPSASQSPSASTSPSSSASPSPAAVQDHGIKVSKPGQSVHTASNEELRFTSEFSSLKLYRWVDAQFTTNATSDGSVEITHDLGYIPVVQVWQKHTASFTFLGATTYPNSFSLLNNYNSYRPSGTGISYSADNQKITVQTVDTPGFAGASPNTTYYFRVLIWVDLSENFSDPSNIALTGDFGFKVSNPSQNVLTAQEYKMAYSSKYKAVQYYDNHILTSSITLPAMWASLADEFVQEAGYVDFNHNLGYPPLFLVYSDLAGANLYEIPYLEISPTGGVLYDGLYEVSAWCDSSRIRVLFHRFSSLQDGNYGEIYAAETINVYVIIFTENLMGTPSG